MLFLVLCQDLVGTRRAELTTAVPVPAILSHWLQMWLLWLDYTGCCFSDLRSILFPSQKQWLRSWLRVQSRSWAYSLHPSLNSSWSTLPNRVQGCGNGFAAVF